MLYLHDIFHFVISDVGLNSVMQNGVTFAAL